MQSGILASSELKSLFNSLVSEQNGFALFATISSEQLVPGDRIDSQSGFPSDLSLLTPHLSATAATYILVKTEPDSPSGYLAITFVPDAAPRRQKMLFASTRLTLQRELGVERFGESIFCTDVDEVSPQGWERHVKHRELEQPLTQEEKEREALREAELTEGTGGTRGRGLGGMDGGAATTTGDGGRSSTGTRGLKRGQGVEDAVGGLKGKGPGELVVLKIDVPNEVLELDKTQSSVDPAQLQNSISHEEPRYAFYIYDLPDSAEPKLIFIYTCPSGSKIKERMVYASSRISIVKMAENDLGLSIAKRLEGGSPNDFPEETIAAEFVVKQEESKGFARPKRPGRR